MGGGQCYMAGKAKYLESQGWNVVVLHSGFYKGQKSPFEFLNRYIHQNTPEIGYHAFEMPRVVLDYMVRKIMRTIGDVSNSDEIIIETHNSTTAVWGELVANKLGAKHVNVCMNENYRGKRACYEKKIEFFKFKFFRGEIGGNADVEQRLFDGYLKVDESNAVEWIIDEDPVQDYDNAAVNAIVKQDWNICYLGRGDKPYVKNILLGIGEFASRHKNKKIQFINVGSACVDNSGIINDISAKNSNLTISDLGNQTPLPRSLYSKIDVMIAGSGSARCSVEEGALTLVADTETCQCNGLLGYETTNSIYKEGNYVESSFADALTRVLVDQVQNKLVFNYPPKKGVAYCTKQNFEMIAKSTQTKEYYPMDKLLEGSKSWKTAIKYIVRTLKS
jgi:hypothetical protein